MIKRENHKIDATDKVLGRLAVEIANLLRGKNKPHFVKHQDVGDFVTVLNVEKIKVTGSKIEQKKYYTHSGYMGGLSTKPLKKLIVEDPAFVLRMAVHGMLCKNKLRPRQIKRLRFQ